MRRTRSAVSLFAAALLVVGSPVVSAATQIDPGFDLFATRQPTQADTPLGLVTFKGAPFDPANLLGNTDTIVQRTGSLPDGGTGPIPIELIALHLVSTSPVILGGVGPVDLHVTINKDGHIQHLPQPDPLPASTGVLLVQTHDDTPGGTFDSVLSVFADLIVTVPGGDPNDPADRLFTAPQDEGQLVANAIIWSHIAPPGYPVPTAFPSGGFFARLPFSEEGPIAIHTVGRATTAIPVPATLTLLALGGLALSVGARLKQVR